MAAATLQRAETFGSLGQLSKRVASAGSLPSTKRQPKRVLALSKAWMLELHHGPCNVNTLWAARFFFADTAVGRCLNAATNLKALSAPAHQATLTKCDANCCARRSTLTE